MAEPTAETERLRLYAYATVPDSATYVAIIRLFAGALLAEWSAHDVAERGVHPPSLTSDETQLVAREGSPVSVN